MTECAIVVQDLYKRYINKKNKKSDGVLALNNINLSIKKGSFFGLIGLNGAGKSTLINIIAGVVNKTSGTIVANGFDLDKDRIQFRRSFGIVSQELIFDPFFTVGQILDYYAGFYGVPKKERRVKEVAEQLGILDKINVKPRMLSGGMKRRLIIAKAIIHNPPIIVFDEPTAGLDIESKYKMWDCIYDINNRGATIVLTTHYMEEIEKFCNDIALIDHGNIIVNCKKDEISNKFRNKLLVLKLTKSLPSELRDKFLTYGADIEASDYSRLVVKSISGDNINFALTQIIKELNSIGIDVFDVETSETSLETIVLSMLNKK